MDRFLPMPDGKLSMDNWGAGCVQPRYIDNGLEDAENSYWGGNIIKDEKGKYHMYVSGWSEDAEKGHMGWLNNSNVYHATADSSFGPFTMQERIGIGHNSEVVKLKDGSYMIYHIDGRGYRDSDCHYYLSKSPYGPWEKREMAWDLRGRARVDGIGATGPKTWSHNMSFARREDGSVLMVSRGGKIFISEDGISKYNRVSNGSVYPYIDGRYEDPVIWRDNVQYNLIVNDWIGRTAFYLRSKDGLNWVVDPGMAYMPGISKHKDGRVENWYKYERMRVYQDEYGRATQANFAVIDTIKHNDLPGDNHSSKNIVIPLNKGMLLEVLNKIPITRLTKEIAVKIAREEGFNPAEEIDLESLHFGASSEVNFGRGAKALRGELSGDDFIVYFEAKNHCITDEEFAPKMLGKNKSGEMIYGYSRLPWIDYAPAILSANPPVLRNTKASVVVDNFGTSTSAGALVSVNVYDESGKEVELFSAKLSPIKPYGSQEVSAELGKNAEKLKSGSSIVVRVHTGTQKPTVFHMVM